MIDHNSLNLSEDPERGWSFLLMLCLAEIATMLLFSSYAAVLPIIQKEWQLTNAQSGWIYGSYQIGYLLAVVVLITLTDFINPRYIYSASAVFAGLSGLLFSLTAEGVLSATILRTMAGIGLAGTYMPGLKIIAEYYSREKRGGAVGLYVGSFTLGVSLSLYFTGKLTALYYWRTAFFLASLGPLIGGILGYVILKGKFKDSSHSRASNKEDFSYKRVATNKPVMIMILAYMGHCWELFGLRGWIVAFLTECLLSKDKLLTNAAETASFMASIILLAGTPGNMISGFVSDRIGRMKAIVISMLISSALSFTLGWTAGAPFYLVIFIALVYGFFVTADSSPLSTAITEFANPAFRGSTMAVQSFLGFLAASISPVIMGWLMDLTNDSFGILKWGWGFSILGLGALIGPLGIYYLNTPQNIKLGRG